jgi:hypothetical protein
VPQKGRVARVMLCGRGETVDEVTMTSGLDGVHGCNA